MRKRRYADAKALAIYSNDEEGFLCQMCQEQHGDSLVYEAWEIVKHLKDPHKFNLNKTERMHRIVGWNDKFEKSYRENKNRKATIKPEDIGQIAVDNTSEEELERKRKRRLMENRARKEALS